MTELEESNSGLTKRITEQAAFRVTTTKAAAIKMSEGLALKGLVMAASLSGHGLGIDKTENIAIAITHVSTYFDVVKIVPLITAPYCKSLCTHSENFGRLSRSKQLVVFVCCHWYHLRLLGTRVMLEVNLN